MLATAWNNGGAQYGIRVGKTNRSKYFNNSWKVIEVEIEGRSYQFALTSGFWRNCPEFRDSGQPIIREWLAKHKTLHWPKGDPPQIQLISLGNGKFRILP